MSKIDTYTLTSVYVNVTVKTVCKFVEIGEDHAVANYPTTAINFKRNSSDSPSQRTAGIPVGFPASGQFWQPGDVAGQVALPSGSTTVYQDET
jgi:hypothetical protein